MILIKRRLLRHTIKTLQKKERTSLVISEDVNTKLLSIVSQPPMMSAILEKEVNNIKYCNLKKIFYLFTIAVFKTESEYTDSEGDYDEESYDEEIEDDEDEEEE